MLDVRDLRMRYGSKDVLHGVTFTARRGEVLALLGPNGAGKTTTIEILEGFRMRSAGEVGVLRFDPAARRECHDLVHRQTDVDDTTVLLTTHDLDGAEKLADRIVITGWFVAASGDLRGARPLGGAGAGAGAGGAAPDGAPRVGLGRRRPPREGHDADRMTDDA